MFNIIYIDPPYKYQDLEGVLDSLAKQTLVEKGGIIAVERDSRTGDQEWLRNAPFQFWQKKIYGDSMLIFFKNRESS